MRRVLTDMRLDREEMGRLGVRLARLICERLAEEAEILRISADSTLLQRRCAAGLE